MTQPPSPPPGFEGRNQPPRVTPAQAEAARSDLPAPPSAPPLPPPPTGFEGRGQPPTAVSTEIEPEARAAAPQPGHSKPNPETDQANSAASTSRLRQLVGLLLVAMVSSAGTLVISSALSDTDDDTADLGEANDDSGDETSPADASSGSGDSTGDALSGATDPTPTTTQPPEPEPYDGPVWDDSVLGPVNAQNLAFTDVEDAAPGWVDAVARIKLNMLRSDASRSFRDNYWASYIVLGVTGCAPISQDYQRMLDEDWSASQVNSILEGLLENGATWARENLVGMTLFTDEEVSEALVASLTAGGCDTMWWEMVGAAR